MLAEMVALPSVSAVDPRWDMGNRAVAERLAGWLEGLGFVCQLQTLQNAAKCNLIATLGHGTGGLVLAGHLDTVPWDEGAWHSDPFQLTERNGQLIGLGIADMKGFLALAAEAARITHGRQLRAPLILLGTADEECGMHGARALSAAMLCGARMAVIGEPTGLRPVSRHKGIFMERIHVHGVAGHSSNPALGHNAIEGMSRVLQALLKLRDELANAGSDPAFSVAHNTLNLGCVHGGDNPNRIPASCQLDVDLRFIPGQDLQQLRQRLHQRVRAALEGSAWQHHFEVLFDGCQPLATAPDAELVRLCRKLTGAADMAVSFATEGPYLTALGLETVILGPGDIEQAHRPDESLPLARLQPTVAVLQQLIQHCCL